MLLLAPGAWAVQTLGHATSGTFPAGGPASARAAAGRGGGGPGGGAGGGRGRPGRPPGRRGCRRAASGVGGAGRLARRVARPAAAPAAAPGAAVGGGPFGGNTQSLTEALAYADAHGGGTLAVSSQSGRPRQLITLGRRRGRRSAASRAARARSASTGSPTRSSDGRIRWVLTDGSGGGCPRTAGSARRDVMAAAAEVGTQTSVDGLYDLRGHAQDLRALAG